MDNNVAKDTTSLTKRFACSKCNMEFRYKTHINNHFKRKNSCVVGDDSIPNCITTLFTNCRYCNEQIKTETAANFMKKHLKTCSERIGLFPMQKEEEPVEDEESTEIDDTEFIESLNGKSGVYIGYAEKSIIKPGSCCDAYRRLYEHKKHLGNDFTIEYFFETPDYKELERKILNHPEIEARRIRRRYGPKNMVYTELVQLSDEFTITHFLNIIYDIKNDADSLEYYRNLSLYLMEKQRTKIYKKNR